MTRILHVSDLHFGRHSLATQVAALEAVIARESLDAIIISGDLSQRTRRREFERAAGFVRSCERKAPSLVVPGNHDCAWWTAILGVGRNDAMFTRYRALVRIDLEPLVRVPGATIVGLNSAHGIQPYTLTLRPRDLAVVGAVRPEQWQRARATFTTAPASDLKVLVLHHNLLRGQISNRWGLASRAQGIEAAARTGADLVCCGHDHEERIEEVQAAGRRLVVSTAGTLTDRSRGGRPGSWHLIEVDEAVIRVTLFEWDAASGDFARARVSDWARTPETRHEA